MTPAAYMHLYIVYRTDSLGIEHPAGITPARDPGHAIEIIKERFPRASKLLALSGKGTADGAFRAEWAYTAPLADVQRMAAIVTTDLAFMDTNNLAVAASHLAALAGIMQAGMAQAVKGSGH